MTVNIPVQPIQEVVEDDVKVLRRVSPNDGTLSVTQAAAKAGVGVQTLRADAVDHGKVPFVTKNGRLYFTETDIEKYIEDRKQAKLLASQQKATRPKRVVEKANVNNRNTTIPTEEEHVTALNHLTTQTAYSYIATGFLAQILRLTPNCVRNLVNKGIIPSVKKGSQFVITRETAFLVYNVRKAGAEGIANDPRLQTEIKVAGLDVEAILSAGTRTQGRKTLPNGMKRYFVILTQEQADELRAQGVQLNDPYEAQKKYSKAKTQAKHANEVVDEDDDDFEDGDFEDDEDNE